MTLDTDKMTVGIPGTDVELDACTWATLVWSRNGKVWHVKGKGNATPRLVLEMGGTVEQRMEWAEVIANACDIYTAGGCGGRWRVTNSSDQLKLSAYLGIEELDREVRRQRMLVSAHRRIHRGAGPSSERAERRIR